MRKLLLPLLLSLSVIFLYFFLSPSSSPSNPNPSPSPRPRVPKIYLYDLPNKFTGGVVEKYAAVRSAAAKYPGHQHSAEWALLEDLRRPDRTGSPVERTKDPEVADLFYVPFFSSLSLIVNPIRPAEGDEGKSAAAYSDEEVQEELMEWLEGSKYWKRNNGRDHIFIAQDPNALYKVIDRVRNGVLILGG